MSQANQSEECFLIDTYIKGNKIFKWEPGNSRVELKIDAVLASFVFSLWMNGKPLRSDSGFVSTSVRSIVSIYDYFILDMCPSVGHKIYIKLHDGGKDIRRTRLLKYLRSGTGGINRPSILHSDEYVHYSSLKESYKI
jgi:hypothetical protein